ncbi:FAD-dependent oxidoreductase [Caballeronia sp. 15711]|uniref:FAD-dependent oxidoreductase n=1 Tax=Caballeronia sp. 15711 TaxID=3391029 RepID=UPI0039E6B1EB
MIVCAGRWRAASFYASVFLVSQRYVEAALSTCWTSSVLIVRNNHSEDIRRSSDNVCKKSPDVDPTTVSVLAEWTRRLFPEVSTGRVIPWAGLRPMLPSMLPRVGRGKRPGVFYNTGHGHLGWTLSAATAGLLAQAVEK